MTETTAPASTGDNGGQISSSAAPTAQPAAASTPTETWMSGLSEERLGYVQNKGWKGPADVVESYFNLEKLRGVPAERLLTIPQDLSDMNALNQVFDKLGRPSDAKGYTFGEVDKTVGEWAGSTFHELGLTKAQGENLMQKWDAWQKDQMSARQTELNDRIANEDKQLRKEWGAAYDQNFEIAKNAAKKLGFNEQDLDMLLSTKGQKATAELFYKLGSGLGEDKFVASDNSVGQGFNGALTPAQAKARIQSLRNDSEFIKRYTNGDVAARNEMSRLHEFAYHE